MNSDITTTEATEWENKKTFDELSDTKNEKIATSNQQHKEQEMKLSNDCNTTEVKKAGVVDNVTQAETLLVQQERTPGQPCFQR